MVDFSNLNRYDVIDKTSEFALTDIDGQPTLTVKAANEFNKPYFNAVLKKSKTSMKRLNKGDVDASFLEKNRDLDKALFPGLVIVGWEGITDASGQDVPFSESACKEFINMLPGWLFDKVRTFCSNNANFVDEVEDIDEKLGN